MFNNRELKDNFKEIFWQDKDVKSYCMIILAFVFNVIDSFEVRNDIEIPNKCDDDIILLFNNGRIGYFKIQSDDVTDELFDSILNVCYHLQDKYGGRVDAYILCDPGIELKSCDSICRDNILIHLTSLKYSDGDLILEKLKSKLINDEEFTFEDKINNILLPYMNYNDKNEFEYKLQKYFNLF